MTWTSRRIVLRTERLDLRHLDPDEDAAFILRLVNEPSWLRYIGDRGVRTQDAARRYILEGPVEMYDRLGFGLFLVELRDGAQPIGLCGLIKRDALEDVDIGFAFLPEYWSRGYAFESSSAVLSWGRRVHGLARVVAVTSPDNDASSRLLRRLGFRYARRLQLSPEAPTVRLYVSDG